MGHTNILNYKFYYKENNVLTIQYFRTLKEINSFIIEKKVYPIQINKREKGFKDLYRLFKKF